MSAKKLAVQGAAAVGVHDGTPVSVDSGTVTRVPIDTVKKESDGKLVVNTTDNTIDVIKPGVYLIVAQLTWASDATNWTTGDFAAGNLRNNGLGLISGSNRKIGTGEEAVYTSGSAKLDSGASISLEAFQDSGSVIDVVADEQKTRLSVNRIADL